MKHYSKTLWWGALKHASRWVYVQHNPVIVVGIMMAMLFAAFNHLMIGVIVALITLLLLCRYVITADRIYVLSDEKGRTTYVTLFRSGYRPVTSFYTRKMQKAILRSFSIREDDSRNLQISGLKISGYNLRFAEMGVFLYKTGNEWRYISGKYHSLYLGENVDDNMFVDKSKHPMIVTFLHGDTVVRYEVTDYLRNPPFIYDPSKATYKPVTACGLVKEDSTAGCSTVMLQNKNKRKLFLYGINEKRNLPRAFQIMVPYVYQTDSRFNKQIPTDREDGSFIYN